MIIKMHFLFIVNVNLVFIKSTFLLHHIDSYTERGYELLMQSCNHIMGSHSFIRNQPFYAFNNNGHQNHLLL